MGELLQTRGYEEVARARPDEWLRRRIRMYIWKRWKRIRTRYAMPRNSGMNHNNAFKFACTRKGYWRIANSQIMNVARQMPVLDKRVIHFSGTITRLLRRKLGSRRIPVGTYGGVRRSATQIMGGLLLD